MLNLVTQIILLTLASATIVRAEDFGQYVNLTPEQYATFIPTETRKVYDLSGTWQVIDDGIATAEVKVPSAIENRDYVRLRKTMKIDQSSLLANSWQLYLLGAVEEVELFVNGRYIMRYPGGYAPFMIRIPDGILRSGQNTIELGVTRLKGLSQRLQRFARSSSVQHMGLLREVFLIGTAHVWTEDIQVRSTYKGNSGSLDIKARIKSGMVENMLGQQVSDGLAVGSVAISAEAQLIDKKSKQVVASSGERTASIARSRELILPFQMQVANPVAWNLADPHLYEIVVRVKFNGSLVDSYKKNFGFRSFSISTVDGIKRFSLNDNVIRLHAIDYTEDVPNIGPSMAYRHFRRDVSMLKTLGVNAIRIRHSIPHPVLLELCDQYGIMVMVDAPLVDIPTSLLKNEEVITRYKNTAERISSYIEAHPSVVAVGISDGLDEGSSIVPEYHRQLVQLFRKQSSKHLYKVVPVSLLNETSDGGFDFVVLRFYSASDSTYFTNLRQDVARVLRSSAVLAEFGSVVSPYNLNGYNDPLSNEAQALFISKFYGWSFGSGLAGVIVWSFNDYTLDRPTMLSEYHDSRISTSGLVDVYRQRRISYDVYKALINDEKLPLLQARDSAFSTPIVFVIAGLLLALAIAFTANQSRRFREYAIRAVLRPYNFYADIRDQRILSLSQTGILGIVIAASVGLVLSSFFFYIRIDPTVEYLLHVLLPGDNAYEILRYMSWNPSVGIFTWMLVILISIVLLSLLLRVGAMFVRGRIYMRDTFTIVVWSSLPLLVLLPIGIGLYQSLSTNQLSLVVPIIMIALAIWSIIRVLRATAIVFDVRSTIVYGIGIGVFIMLFSLMVISWDAANDGFAFLGYYLSVVS